MKRVGRFVAPLAVAVGACACGTSAGPSPSASGSSAPPPARSSAAAAPSAPSPGSAAPSAAPPDALPTRGDADGACPDGMRLIQGDYCPAVSEKCLAWNEVNVRGVALRNQCKRYEAPTKCLSPKREPLRFCMDTFEWPNRKGAIPRNLTSWQEARDACIAIGKRLCTDVEFTFACEGEEMRPHVTGFDRDPSKCSYDRPYRLRTFNFAKHDACLADAPCKAALEQIDQRLPAGSMPSCVSPDGVFDLNGNVNEWVELPGRGLSKRAGLKGGWWGPVRDRCRPITTFHGESDYGYEVGFRCCSDAKR